MISKIFTGHSFAGAVKYVVEDERRAVVLEVEGLRDWDYRLMTEDFVRQAGLNPAKTKACFHAILSFAPDDKVDDKMMSDIALEYLVEMGLANTQIAVVKHTDKAHLHVHLLANLVDNDGKSIKDSWMGLKGKKIAQRLTKKYGLIPAIKKDLTKTHQEALSEAEAARYKIYQTIQATLPFCNTLDDLIYRLKKGDIDTMIKYKSGSTTERQGISFKMGDFIFKGSKVDRMFSLAGIEKRLENQQYFKHVKRDAMTPEQASQNPSFAAVSKQPDTMLTGIAEGLGQVAGLLMQPEQNFDPIANEMTRFKRKKKRKGLQR